MGTNPLGPGTVNLTANVPEELHAALKVLAQKSGKKVGPYVRKVLEDAARAGVTFREVRNDEYPAPDVREFLAAEDAPAARDKKKPVPPMGGKPRSITSLPIGGSQKNAG